MLELVNVIGVNDNHLNDLLILIVCMIVGSPAESNMCFCLRMTIKDYFDHRGQDYDHHCDQDDDLPRGQDYDYHHGQDDDHHRGKDDDHHK